MLTRCLLISEALGFSSLLSVHGATRADHDVDGEGACDGAVIIGTTGVAGIAGGVHAGVAGMGAAPRAGVDVGGVHAEVAGMSAEAAGTDGVAIGATGSLELRTTWVDWLVA